MESTLNAKGQVTIPKAIRDHLGLKLGDRVKFFTHPDGTVALLPKRPASGLRGIAKAGSRATPKKMNKANAAGSTFSATRSEDVFGSLRYTGRPKTIKEMDAGIATEILRRHIRGRY